MRPWKENFQSINLPHIFLTWNQENKIKYHFMVILTIWNPRKKKVGSEKIRGWEEERSSQQSRVYLEGSEGAAPEATKADPRHPTFAQTRGTHTKKARSRSGLVRMSPQAWASPVTCHCSLWHRRHTGLTGNESAGVGGRLQERFTTSLCYEPRIALKQST